MARSKSSDDPSLEHAAPVPRVDLLAAIPSAGPSAGGSVSCDTEGGKEKDKHLVMTVVPVDDFGSSVVDAQFSIDLFRDGSLIGWGTGATGTAGAVTFTLSKASSGC